MKEWIEGEHYYLNDEGFVVFTEKYHLERGYCCGHGCKHCPFGRETSLKEEKKKKTEIETEAKAEVKKGPPHC